MEEVCAIQTEDEMAFLWSFHGDLLPTPNSCHLKKILSRDIWISPFDQA